MLPSIDNFNNDPAVKEAGRIRTYNTTNSPNKSFKIEISTNQGFFVNQAYKLDQKLITHLHMMGVPIQHETGEAPTSLNDFLKIKALNLSSQTGVPKKSPQKLSSRGKKFRPVGKKNSFLDSSFDRYAEQMQKIEFLDAKGMRRSLSGMKVAQYDGVTPAGIGDADDENELKERQVWSAAGKSTELYALRNKAQFQGIPEGPEYRRLHGKYSMEDQNPYNLFPNNNSDNKKFNSVAIKFNPLEAIQENPLRAKAYSHNLDPTKINSNLISANKPTPPLQFAMRSMNNPSFVTPVNGKSGNNNLLASILNKANGLSANSAYNPFNHQSADNQSGSLVPNNTLQSLSITDRNEDPKASFIQSESLTPINNNSTGTGSTSSQEKDKNEDVPVFTNYIHSNLNNKPGFAPKSPSTAQKSTRNTSLTNQNSYSPNVNRPKQNLNNSFTGSKTPNNKVDDKPKKTFIAPPQPTVYRYSLGPGNNVGLVRRVLRTRDWWEETETTFNPYNFKWQQTTRGFRYDKLVHNPNFTITFNHFEFHREISTKNGLIKNLAAYCEANKINLFDLTPTTFVFDMDDEANFDTEMQKFAKFFIKNHPDPNRYPRPDPNDKKNHSVWYNFDYRRKKYTPANLLNEKKPSPYLKPKLHKTFLQGYNVWVLKPTGLNRGRGIEIFNTLEALNSYINVFFEGRRAKRVKKEDEYESDEEDESEDDNKLPNYQGPVVKSHTFVIQKYIENLLVVNNRKFDIRVWILVTQDMQLYFFKEGYLRTCCYEYSLNQETIDNKFIHLTNNAVQKHCDDYGQFEKGNQLSFSDFEKYIRDHKLNVDLRGKVLPRMKELIMHSMNSVKRVLNMNDRKYTFEIFGYDFMIDAEGTVWLIEVNTNPCIEESSPLLGKLLPRMIDDAFKLTLDVIYPKPTKPEESFDKGKGSKKKKDEESEYEESESESEDARSDRETKTFSVDGYPDDENMWEFLCSLQVPKAPVKKPVKPTSNPGANK